MRCGEGRALQGVDHNRSWQDHLVACSRLLIIMSRFYIAHFRFNLTDFVRCLFLRTTYKNDRLNDSGLWRAMTKTIGKSDDDNGVRFTMLRSFTFTAGVWIAGWVFDSTIHTSALLSILTSILSIHSSMSLSTQPSIHPAFCPSIQSFAHPIILPLIHTFLLPDNHLSHFPYYSAHPSCLQCNHQSIYPLFLSSTPPPIHARSNHLRVSFHLSI